MKSLIMSLTIMSCGSHPNLESYLINVLCTNSKGVEYSGEVQDLYLKDGYWIVVEKDNKRMIRMSGHCRRID